MPSKIKKTDLEKLTTLDDATRADLMALFSDLEERDTQITTLKKKADDSDQVVARNKELEGLNKQQATKTAELEGKLSGLLGKPSGSFSLSLEDLPVIAPFLDLFSDEPAAPANPPPTA